MATKAEKGGTGAGRAIFLLVVGLMALAGEGLAALPYRPAGAVSIQSEYGPFSAAVPPHTQVWRVVAAAGEGGATTLRFFLEAAAAAGPVCDLTLPPPGTAGEIHWRGTEKGGRTKSAPGLLLLPGFPAPCDVLPLGPGEGAGTYGERVEAGGRVFSRSYRVASETVTAAAARAAGWIRAEDPGTAELIMVSVSDERGRMLVRQLWPSAGSWWLYEETPLRRSWLIR